MEKAKQEKLIRAFIGLKMAGDFSSENVKKTMSHLFQLGIWDESKEILKDFILTYWGFIEDAEYCNGEVRRKRNNS